MAYIRTFIEFAIVSLAMVILTPVGLLVLLLHFAGLKKISAVLMYKAARLWALLVIAGTGCSLKASGQENIPKKGGICLVSNHSGIFDIVLMLAYAGRPFGFIAKKELSYVPFLNMWILILGGFFIDRKNPRKALKTISNGVKHIAAGGAMVIFPEGTRSKGRGLLPFRPGSFKLAVRSSAQIIPVAISGSYDAFEKNKLVIPCPVSISFGAPIPTAELETAGSKEILANKVHGIIDEMLKNQ